MIDSILVPLDGSELARKALDCAKSLNPQELRLLRVQTAPYVVGYPLEPSLTPEILDAERKHCEAYLENLRQELESEGLRVHCSCRSGDAASEILDEAAQARVTMIAIGTHGRTGLSRFLLGSVAERVARHAPCPVLLVRVGEPPAL